MLIVLKLNRGNVSLEGRCIFTKTSGYEYRYTYNKVYSIKDETTFLMKFLGKRQFCILDRERCYIGSLKMRGLRNLTICIHHPKKSIDENVTFIKHLFSINKTFHVSSTLYHMKDNEIALQSHSNIDDWDILIGCFTLCFFNKMGKFDAAFDIGDD